MLFSIEGRNWPALGADVAIKYRLRFELEYLQLVSVTIQRIVTASVVTLSSAIRGRFVNKNVPWTNIDLLLSPNELILILRVRRVGAFDIFNIVDICHDGAFLSYGEKIAFLPDP